MKASRRMAWLAGLVFEVIAVGFLAGCGGDDTASGPIEGGVEAGPDVAADVVAADRAAETGPADSTMGDTSADGGGLDVGAEALPVAEAGPGVPALPPDAGTITCPTTINGSLDPTDGTQIGRYSRVGQASACGTTKTFPTTQADSTMLHLYDAYRFANPTGAAVCFSFTLTYGAIIVTDAGSDADAGTGAETGSDAAGSDASAEAQAGDAQGSDAADAGGDGASSDSAADSAGVGGSPDGGPMRYMTAYSTFYPADLTTGYLGDVGAMLVSPQTMGITVPAGGTIDVVVHAIDIAPAGVGAYTLSCTAQ